MVGKIERRDNFQFINGQDERDNLKHEFKLGNLVEILIRRRGFMKSTVDYKMTFICIRSWMCLYRNQNSHITFLPPDIRICDWYWAMSR